MYEDDDILDKQERALRLLISRRQDDLSWLMSDLRGRRFVWALLVSTRYETTQTLFDTHGGRQSYLVGAFEVGRGLSQEIRSLLPELYVAMVQENTLQPEEVTQ